MGSDTDKPIEHTSTPGELDDHELDQVSGGLAIEYKFQITFGHTVYDCSVRGGTDGFSASANGVASR